jgi:hypothetical protein
MSDKRGLLDMLLGSFTGGNIVNTVLNLFKAVWSMVKPMINALINILRSFIMPMVKGTFLEPIMRMVLDMIGRFTAM